MRLNEIFLSNSNSNSDIQMKLKSFTKSNIIGCRIFVFFDYKLIQMFCYISLKYMMLVHVKKFHQKFQKPLTEANHLYVYEVMKHFLHSYLSPRPS